ncbi:MAG TPA: hypothetical protein VMA36_06490 [Candidatus Limnocylindria bacterium]|nr:hypothetical protein [Candidatus Limnocylindria bacterium]
MHTLREQLVQRERGVLRLRGARQRVFGAGEPTGLELALRERASAVRPEQRGCEVELRAIVIADRVGIALVPVAHRPDRDARRDAQLVGVHERRSHRPDDLTHLRVQPAQIGEQVRRRIRLVVDVRALVVVELHRDDAVGDGSELREHAVQPARGVAPVRRVAQPLRRRVVAVRVLQCRGRGIASVEDVAQRHVVVRAPQQPRRIAAVAPFVADDGTGTHDEVKAELLAEAKHRAQVAARVGVPVEVERAVGDFVPVPGDVQIERVDAHRPQRKHRVAPARGRDPLVEERAAEEEERLAVDEELRRAIALHDPCVSERRSPIVMLSRSKQRRGSGSGPRQHCEGERRERRRERPRARIPSASEEDERTERERPQAERDRVAAAAREQEEPAGERDERRQGVERDAKRRRRRRAPHQRERDDLTDALHEHDPRRQRRDHRAEREQRGGEREQSDRDERDVREAPARV